MKYKVGDKVKVKNDLVDWQEYGGNTFISNMDSAKGRCLKITNICEPNYYLEGFGSWGFTDEMIDGLAKENKPHDKPCFVIDKARGFKSIYIDGITIAIPIETIVGIAYKNPSDEYDEERGKSLAYYRMEGQACEI